MLVKNSTFASNICYTNVNGINIICKAKTHTLLFRSYSSTKTKNNSTDGSPLYPISNIPPPKNYDPMKYRKWIQLNPNPIDQNEKISIMSYNLLSQHYVWKQVFGYLQKDFLDWPHYRFPLINKTIEHFQCDIMCFQELESLVYYNEWKQNYPKKNYESVYVRKSNPLYWGNKPVDQMDGVGIFINKDRFDLIDHKRINFAKYIGTHLDKFSVTNDLRKRLLPRNTVALLVKLRDKLNGKIVYVANTHLYWSPKFNDVKAYQTKLLLSLLRDFIGDYKPDSPPNIIMCGDWNSTPASIVYDLLSTGKINLDQSREFLNFNYGSRINNEILIDNIMKSPFLLSPAYEALLKGNAYAGHKLKFTSYTRSLTAVLDHIWYSRDQFNVYRVLSEVDTNYTLNAKVNGFPNDQFPSDHIPLVTELTYL